MTKSENYTGSPPRFGAGKTGPVNSLVNRMQLVYQDAWIPAVTQCFNISENHDSLDGGVAGVSFQPTNINPTHYTRSYSVTAYLPPAGPNLKVLTNTSNQNQLCEAGLGPWKKETRTSHRHHVGQRGHHLSPQRGDSLSRGNPDTTPARAFRHRTALDSKGLKNWHPHRTPRCRRELPRCGRGRWSR